MNGIPAWAGDAAALSLLVMQVPMLAVLLARLLPSLRRPSPLPPGQPGIPLQPGLVSVLLPTLNEAERIDPCLEGLHQQSSVLREVLVVDSRSQDGTPEKVLQMAKRDPRFRLVTDDPLPNGWVGRPWALHYGFLQSDPASEWILGIDADTRPQPGLVERLLETAQAQGLDLITLAPQFILQHWGGRLAATGSFGDPDLSLWGSRRQGYPARTDDGQWAMYASAPVGAGSDEWLHSGAGFIL